VAALRMRSGTRIHPVMAKMDHPFTLHPVACTALDSLPFSRTLSRRAQCFQCLHASSRNGTVSVRADQQLSIVISIFYLARKAKQRENGEAARRRRPPPPPDAAEDAAGDADEDEDEDEDADADDKERGKEDNAREKRWLPQKDDARPRPTPQPGALGSRVGSRRRAARGPMAWR